MPENNPPRERKLLFLVIFFLTFTGLAVFILKNNLKHRVKTSSQTPDSSQYQEAIKLARNLMWKDINSGKASSAEVAIMDNGQVVYSEGFGMADRENSIPVDNNTRFNIGSISKVYVVAAIMKLVDEGKVSLDKPVVDYLPEFTMSDPRYKDITVRMILSHSSGLPGSNYANSFTDIEFNTQILKETLATLCRSHLKAAPGEVAPYTNDGYSLAEMIVEKVSGEKYIDFLTKNFFEPLGLKNTGLSIGTLKEKPIALYYDPATGKKQPAEVASVIGAGGLSSTATDLCRFVLAITSDSGNVLKPSSVEEIKKPQPYILGEELGKNSIKWGLGWDYAGLPFYDNYGIHILGKDGGTMEYTSMLFVVPEKLMCVAAFESGQSNVDKNAGDILNEVLRAKSLIPQEEKTLSLPVKSEPIPAKYVSYNGYYVGTNGAVTKISIDTKNNTLTSHSVFGQTPDSVYVYRNGHFTNEELKDTGYLDFVAIDSNEYGVFHSVSTGTDMLILQKAKAVQKPVSLKINIDGKEWLQKNVNPYVKSADFLSHIVSSKIYQGLSGYVEFNGAKKVQSPTFAAMPVSAMRDLTELQLIVSNGETWVWNSDRLYFPADKVDTIKSGDNSVQIGSEGYTEWLKTDDGMVLSFTISGAGRMVVFDTNKANAVIYDSMTDSGDVYAPKGSFIEFLGNPNDKFTVTGNAAEDIGEKLLPEYQTTYNCDQNKLSLLHITRESRLLFNPASHPNQAEALNYL